MHPTLNPLTRICEIGLVTHTTSPSAEISLDHARIVLNLLWLSFGDLSSKIQNDDSVGSIHDQLHVVFDQENGRTVFRDAAKDFRQTARFIVV
jgi:hypothetical protein